MHLFRSFRSFALRNDMRRLPWRPLTLKGCWIVQWRHNSPKIIRSFASTGAKWSSGPQVNEASQPWSSCADSFNRSHFDQSLRKNLFYVPSFDIYQGIGSTETRGLYDYGPPGCALQANIVDAWRKHFILEEDMLEVDCTSLTPHEVLKASGHVDRFTDWICKDSKTGESFRADHLIKETLESRLQDEKVAATKQEAQEQVQVAFSDGKTHNQRGASTNKRSRLDESTAQEYEAVLAKIDTYTGKSLGELIELYNIRSPLTGEKVDPPVPFNLMFETKIGPTSTSTAFLRPETAQGQFLNFQKLLNHNQQSMPFASASVGKCYRNEISPRSGLLRVREFLLAEIEHFVDPSGNKQHARFKEVSNVEMCLLERGAISSSKQQGRYITISQAVSERLVDNQTLGYFLARIQLFLVRCGVDPSKLRFRQHDSSEMAHYATDCWDAELLTSYGWIECVGCADRSAYDLTVHSKRSGRPLAVRQQLETPLEVEQYEIEINRKLFGPRFRETSKAIEQALLNLSQQDLGDLALELSSSGQIKIRVDGQQDEEGAAVILGKDLVSIDKRKRMITQRDYTPNVIEPSFGIGRILYALLEHSWWTRRDGRGVLSLPHLVAPVKVLVAPLSRHPDLMSLARRIASRLRAIGISNRVDDSSTSIGRRYSRMDEMGTPMGLTVDFQSLKDQSCTLRDRDTLEQVRAGEEQIFGAVRNLAWGVESWKDVSERLPKFEGQQLE